MADAFAIERFKAHMLPRTARAPVYAWTPQQREDMLVRAVTMAEIREAAHLLGLTFNTAYRERERLYRARWGV